jgi:hypothetical protein
LSKIREVYGRQSSGIAPSDESSVNACDPPQQGHDLYYYSCF